MLLYLNLNRSLDELRDFFAFRIILFENDFQVCYKLANKLIDLMILQGFMPCEATEKINAQNFEQMEGIIVPKKTFLDEKNINLVKD